MQIATQYKWKWLPVTDGGLCPRNASGSRSNHDRNSFLHHAPPLHTLLKKKQIGKQEAIIRVLFNQLSKWNRNIFSPKERQSASSHDHSCFPEKAGKVWLIWGSTLVTSYHSAAQTSGLASSMAWSITLLCAAPFYFPPFISDSKIIPNNYQLIYRSIMRLPLSLSYPHLRQNNKVIEGGM